MHNMFNILFAKSNYKHNGLININKKSNKHIAKIYFNPNSNYIYINTTEEYLLTHFDILNAPKTLIIKYKLFKQLYNYNVHEIHVVNFNEKGINLRELFIDQYRLFLWNKISAENNNKIQTIAHFYSKNIGKIPFIIYGELILAMYWLVQVKFI